MRIDVRKSCDDLLSIACNVLMNSFENNTSFVVLCSVTLLHVTDYSTVTHRELWCISRDRSWSWRKNGTSSWQHSDNRCQQLFVSLDLTGQLSLFNRAISCFFSIMYSLSTAFILSFWCYSWFYNDKNIYRWLVYIGLLLEFVSMLSYVMQRLLCNPESSLVRLIERFCNTVYCGTVTV